MKGVARRLVYFLIPSQSPTRGKSPNDFNTQWKGLCDGKGSGFLVALLGKNLYFVPFCQQAMESAKGKLHSTL